MSAVQQVLSASSGVARTLAAGDAFTINAAQSLYSHVVALSETKALALYYAGGDLYAVVLSVSGTTITAGTPLLAVASVPATQELVKLTSTQAILGCYPLTGTSSWRTLNVSGDTVTAGTAVTIASTQGASVCKLTDATGLLLYAMSSGFGDPKSRLITVSGTDLVLGTANTHASLTGLTRSEYSSVAVSSTKVVSINYFSKSRVWTVAGDSQTYTEDTVSDVGAGAMLQLTDTKALNVYRAYGSPYYGKAFTVTESSGSSTEGTAATFESAASSGIGACALSSDVAMVTYIDGGNSSYGTACLLGVSGTDVVPATPIVFESAAINGTRVAALTGSKAIVIYGTSAAAKARVLYT